MSTLAFFGLRVEPFSPTPDPKFLYLTKGHREALAQLVYGVREHKGFILLIGDVGTGKTTLLNTLVERLDQSTSVASVVNSMLPFDTIVEYVLQVLGIAKLGDSPARQLISLQNALLERARAGQNTVLILDEAQNLDVHTLEQVRLLSNFETPSRKTLQIVLAGQPELRARLELPELRQLKQRIALRCGIRPLTRDETQLYIRARLAVAGSNDPMLFSEPAITRIAGYSRGIPRVINTVCDHCLVSAYAEQTRRVDRNLVEEAIADLEFGESPRRTRILSRWRAAFVGWFTRSAWGVAGLGLVALAQSGGLPGS